MTRKPPTFPKPKHAPQAGVSLIEALVAVFVLAVGMLGIASLQASSLRGTQSALERSQTVFLTHSILDAIRANVPMDSESMPDIAAYDTGGQWIGAEAPCKTVSSIATGKPALAVHDLRRWVENIKTNLREGACGKVSCDTTTRLCTAFIRWDDSRAKASNEQIVQTTSRL